MLIALDIETACAKPGCSKFGYGRECTEGHALLQHFNNITCAAVFYVIEGKEYYHVFRDSEGFIAWLTSTKQPLEFIFHNGKFDLKSLKTNWNIDLAEMYYGDSEIAAVACPIKVSEGWLEAYEEKRKQLNKLAKKAVHRNAGGYSLKTLAPFFLECEPFWETDNHDDDKYVVKDARYTYYLYTHLISLLKELKCVEFYDKLMTWNRTLLNIEQDGVLINTELLHKKELEAKEELLKTKNELDILWKDAYEEFYKLKLMELHKEYDSKLKLQLDKIITSKKGDTTLKIEAKKIQYNRLVSEAEQKIERGLNLSSPKQLTWLLKDYFKYDIRNNDGEESTGNEVIESLIQKGHTELFLFQKYRELEKLINSFFSSYKENLIQKKLHTTFKIAGTRTGRLSSSTPLNLQQVPGHLHDLFIPEKNKLFFTADYSSLEPVLIAYFSEDKNLCKVILEGRNFHDFVTKNLLDLNCDEKDIKKLYKKERDLLKQVDLSLLYGAGPNRLFTTALQHGFKWELNFCKNLYLKFKAMFPKYFEWKKEVEIEYRKNGFIRNLMDRPLFIEKEEDLYLKGVNTLIQSSGSDLLMNSINQINKLYKVKLTVHDEVVVEIPSTETEKTAEIIKNIMTNYTLTTQYGNIPLNIEYKINTFWGK